MIEEYTRKPVTVRVIKWDGTSICHKVVKDLFDEYGLECFKNGDKLNFKNAAGTMFVVDIGEYLVFGQGVTHWMSPAFHANFEMFAPLIPPVAKPVNVGAE